jgi:electron transfer flavoprotein alpha subunit
MGNDILVLAEQRGGHLHATALQLVTAARELAKATGGEVLACVVGHNVSEAAGKLGADGVSTVLTIDDAALELYSPLQYTTAAAVVIEKTDPKAVLLAATFMGRDWAPRLAARLKAGLASDCTEVKIEGDAVHACKGVCNGKAIAEFKFDPTQVAIASIRPNTFGAAAAGDGSVASESVAFSAGEGDDRVRTAEVVSTSSGIKDVTEADIVVSGGRALKSEENFKILEEMAQVLDAAVGCSRAAADAGYQPHSRQVGLTGKTVTPKLYLAFGIDGAIQHLAGMRGSKTIVAVNTKADAPIFQVASYGLVADLFQVAPVLTQEFRKLKDL